MKSNQKAISKSYLAWLSATVFFLSIGLFLFIQELAAVGSDMFAILSFPVLLSIIIALSLLSFAGIYQSLKSDDLKTKYRWLESTILLLGISLTLLLEILSRTGLGISNIIPFQTPTDLTMPLLLLATSCALISKRYKNID